ncbi:MAG: DMT family transporter [bacterium]|nr:DMT family transporter [bacterium]
MKVHAALLFAQLGFGGFPVVGKVVLAHLDPLALAGFRVLAATPILMAIAWSVDRVIPNRRDLLRLALLGFLGVAANQLLFIQGLHFTTATNAALLLPAIPVFAAAVAIFLRIERASLRRIAGIVLSVVGALVMLEPGRFQAGDLTFVGNLLILANCLSYAIFLVLMRPLLERLSAVTVTAWAFVFGGAGVLLVTTPALVEVDYGALPGSAWAGLAFIVLVPTVLSYLINTWGVARSSASLAATYTTLQPLITGFLAFFLLAERVGWPQIAGGLLIIGGLHQVARASNSSTT